jgi:DNA-directed RNA polymerase specialized sigma subunit
MAKKKRHYVNNKDFLDAMVLFRDKVIEASKKGKSRPRVPHYIGECLMKIAVNLSHKPNFSGYTYKEDMISDGIENCLQYIDNFDPEKSKNPFAYFTQIIYYAFLRRIAKEKKVLYTKLKYSEESYILNTNKSTQEGDDTEYTPPGKVSEWSNEYVDNFIEQFEETKRKKRITQNTPVDVILKDDE